MNCQGNNWEIIVLSHSSVQPHAMVQLVETQALSRAISLCDRFEAVMQLWRSRWTLGATLTDRV